MLREVASSCRLAFFVLALQRRPIAPVGYDGFCAGYMWVFFVCPIADKLYRRLVLEMSRGLVLQAFQPALEAIYRYMAHSLFPARAGANSAGYLASS